MKLQEINKTIKLELEYIPKGPKGSTQNKLRFRYVADRRRGIKHGLSREQCLKDAINRVKTDYPNFVPIYDETFFRTPKKSLLQKILDRIGL